MKRQCLIAALGFLAGGAWVNSAARAALPNNDEQYWLELVNRVRLHPAAELSKLVNLNPGSPATWGDPISSDPDVASAIEYFQVDPEMLKADWASLVPTQPLAWNTQLHNAAAGHNAVMIEYREQSHQIIRDPIGTDPGFTEPNFAERISNAGYSYRFAGENVYAYSHSALYGQAGFLIDWGEGPGGMQNPAGHRDNLMDRDFKEVGIAITPFNDPANEFGPLVVTQDFGTRTGNSFVTGVVYSDTIKQDQFYTPGEGLSGVSVEVRRAATGALVAASVTYSSGGYSVRVPNGTYDVIISGGELGDGMTYRNVVVAGENIKLDNASSWMGVANAAWTSVGSWLGGVPNGIGTVATLGTTSGEGSSVLVNAAVTVGTINFIGAQGFVVEGGNTLTLHTPSGSARINLAQGGNHRIMAPLAMSSDAEIAVGNEGALSLEGTLGIAASKTVRRTGSGVLQITGIQSHGTASAFIASEGVTNFASDSGSATSRKLGIHVDQDAVVNFQASQHLRQLTIDGGRAALEGGSDKVLFTDGLTIENMGQFDLADNNLIVHASSSTRQAVLAEITRQIQSARNSSPHLWQGPGLTSSMAAPNGLTGLAIILNDSGDGTLFRQFAGEVVDGNDILVKYTSSGDVNLDGKVDFADYFLVDRGFLRKSSGYRNGDLNYDGKIDFGDYFLIDRAFLSQSGILGAGGDWPVVAVPEPGVLSIALIVVGASLRRRRTNA